ncbi:hypothetical protein pb186bvf_006699 [Paramecium bursaria]
MKQVILLIYFIYIEIIEILKEYLFNIQIISKIIIYKNIQLKIVMS